MSMVEWAVDQNVAILSMNNGENRFNIPFCSALLEALDHIEQKTKANVLVVKSSDAKIWCNGIDLDWLLPAIERKDPEVERFFDVQDKVYKRVTFFPMITVASLTGHAFAGGAILAASFDFRFMRSDRGFLCFPEVDINIPFLPYMDMLIRRMLPMNVAFEGELTGKRFTATELEKCGAIRKACPSADDTVREAVAWAKTLNKGRGVVHEIKRIMNADIGHLIDNVIRPKVDMGNVHYN